MSACGARLQRPHRAGACAQAIENEAQSAAYVALRKLLYPWPPAPPPLPLSPVLTGHVSSFPPY
jgi:hypothetical protein